MTTTDSAASATAYHCGVKTKYEAIGVDDTVERNVCATVDGATVRSVLDLAAEEGICDVLLLKLSRCFL